MSWIAPIIIASLVLLAKFLWDREVAKVPRIDPAQFEALRPEGVTAKHWLTARRLFVELCEVDVFDVDPSITLVAFFDCFHLGQLGVMSGDDLLRGLGLLEALSDDELNSLNTIGDVLECWARRQTSLEDPEA